MGAEIPSGTVRLRRIASELEIFASRVADPQTRPTAVEIYTALTAASAGIAWAVEQVEDRPQTQTQETAIMSKWITRLTWVARLRSWWTRVREYGR